MAGTIDTKQNPADSLSPLGVAGHNRQATELGGLPEPRVIGPRGVYIWKGMRKVKLMSEASSVKPTPRLVTTEVLSSSA